MSRKSVLVALFACSVTTMFGCKGFDGPFVNRNKERPDLPQYTIEEQRKRARGRYAMPDDDFRNGPVQEIYGVSPVK